MWSEIVLGLTGSLIVSVGGTYGLFKLGQYSQRKQIEENIKLLEERIKKNDDEKDELSKLLDEHKDFLN